MPTSAGDGDLDRIRRATEGMREAEHVVDGAETFARDPYPLLKLVKPFQRVSGKRAAPPGSRWLDPAASGVDSFSVVPPTSIETVCRSRAKAPPKGDVVQSLGVSSVR